MKLIFAGTPQFSAYILAALLKQGFQIKAVLTQPDRPKGRGRKLEKSPVKILAEKHHLPIFQPQNFKKVTIFQELEKIKPDFILVAAYGLIVPQKMLNLPKLGCINVHASLLPRWRGAAPIQYAILHGDFETGISIMRMDQGMDTGPIYSQAPLLIEATDDAASLNEKLMHLGAKSLIAFLSGFPNLQAKKQNESGVFYCPKIEKSQSLIEWNNPASDIHRLMRAFNPWPVAHTYLNNQLLKIWQAELIEESSKSLPGVIIIADKHAIVVACKMGSLKLLTIQIPGGKAIPAIQLINRNPPYFKVGQQLMNI